MKNLFNDISQEEKNRILEMYSGKKNIIKEDNMGLSMSTLTPQSVEQFFIEKFNTGGLWTTIDELKNTYQMLKQLDGKKVSGKTKCFSKHYPQGVNNLPALQYLSTCIEFQGSAECNLFDEHDFTPGLLGLYDEINSIGTRTLGEEGISLKNQILQMLIKNGLKKT